MDIQFQEVQYFPELVFAIIVAIALNLLLHYRRIPLTISIAICLLWVPLLHLFLQQRTVVDDQIIHIQFGWIPFIQHTIPLEEVTGQKTVVYVPMDHSWGVWQDVKVVSPFMPRGEQGLLLEMKDGSRYLIASRRIKELQ